MKKQPGHVFLSTKKKDQACQNMPVDDSDNKSEVTVQNKPYSPKAQVQPNKKKKKCRH